MIKKLRSKIFDIYDISITYVRFVFLHRWNKLNERHFDFLESSGWYLKNEQKRKLYNKIKKLNGIN